MNATGEELKERGTQLVLEYDSDWTSNATIALRSFIRSVSANRYYLADGFTSEDFRECATKAGLPNPRHPNAWGALLSVFAKRGEIRTKGFAKAKRAEAHSRYIKVWEPVDRV